MKCAGLTGKQLAARAIPPSSLSLPGLIRHSADAGRSWFRRHMNGEDAEYLYGRHGAQEAAFEEASPSTAADDYASLMMEWLDGTFVTERGSEISLRWVCAHMIEEYARHNGHAGLLRELVDGTTGF